MNDAAALFSSNVGAADGFSGQIRGQRPHAVDRELSAILQDNYNLVDGRRGKTLPAADLPGSWERLGDAEVRAAGIDPSLLQDRKSGFDASLYRNAQGAVVVAYAGTDELKDWGHNIAQGLGFRDAQYDQAIALAQEAKQAFGNNVILTGHSLGGGLAAAASMVSETPAVTFNAAGVHNNTLERYDFDAKALKQQAEQGLIRSYHVKNELLTHLQEDSLPLKWVMPDAVGHKIELPDPDPQSFFERLIPGKMLKHRLDMHFIDAVMEAQDLANLQVRPHAVLAVSHTAVEGSNNRLLCDAVNGLAGQRQQLGLQQGEQLFNTAACLALNARQDGLQRIDHVVQSQQGQNLFAVQGELQDPTHQRSRIDLQKASQVPAQQSALGLRALESQQQVDQQQVEQQRRIAMG